MKSGTLLFPVSLLRPELFAVCQGYEAEGYGEDDGYDRRERHAFEGDGAYGDAGGADADTHDEGGEQQVQRIVVVDLRLDEHADTRGSYDAEQQQ